MKNILVRAALGISVMAGSLAAAAPAEAYVFRNLQGEENNQQMCMGVSAGNMTPGTPVINWSCINNDADQIWNLNYISTQGWDQLVDSKQANRCLEAKNGGTTNGTPLVIEECTTT